MDRHIADAPASASVTTEPVAGTSRRGLLGVAGLAGLATAFVSSTASAAPEEQPSLPTDGDQVLLVQAMALELTARDLYRRRLADDVGAGDITDLVRVLADNHRAYAEAIAGAIGVPARRRADTIYEENVAAFEGGRVAFLAAAHTLEQSAVATHTALLDQYESVNAVNLTASILVVEARHATVIADLLGADLDTRLDNSGTPLELRSLPA